MCGIAGVFDFEGGEPRHQSVINMLAAMHHRGPDDEGVWDDVDGPVTLGHRRLSVIDVSSAGHEPMKYRGETFVLTFNGEIYNFEDLKHELKSKGHVFTSLTDAEVLLAGYAEWGPDVLQRLVGMFAFAIWDNEARSLFLARDRAGEKPLYYSQCGKRLAFASELRALAQCSWLQTAVNKEAVAQYLQYGFIPAPYTIYEGARKLAPGHFIQFDGSELKLECYWNPVEIALGPRAHVSFDRAVEQLEELLSRAVKQQMVADVPLGAFLSGGVDSSMIAALMSQTGQSVKTFTIGFDAPDFDESPHAEAVARHLGTDHHAERLTLDDALRLVASLPETFSEPFGDPSALPMQLVSKAARRHVTVCLSGDGGDELFGGYPVYKRMARWDRSIRFARCLDGRLLNTLSGLPGRPGRQVRRLIEYSQGGLIGYRHYFTPNEVRHMLGQTNLGEGAIEHTWRATRSLSTVRRAMVSDYNSYLPEDVLTKVDRTTMSASLESRAPFLDHRIAEWALRLPDALVSDKLLLKRLLHRHVPKSIVDRPKHGFSVPVSRWLREELRESLLEALEPQALASFGIERPEIITTMAREHVAGSSDHGRALWLLYALQNWRHNQGRSGDLAA